MKNLTNNPLALSVAITAALVAPIATAAGHHAGFSAASVTGPLSAMLSPATLSPAAETAPVALPAQTAVRAAAKPTPENAPLVTIELSKEEKALADRMALALGGQKVSKHRAPARALAAPSNKPSPNPVWVCGQWEELWQGRGAAQTCQWR